MGQIAYHYDPKTREYLNQSAADESPLEAGTFLYPAHSTPKKPPVTGDHEAAVFDPALDTWSVMPDLRGQVVYDQAGERVSVMDLGPLPPNLSATAPVLTAAQIQAILDTNKTAATLGVDAYHASTVQQLAGNPTQVEKDTWAMKLATANAVSAGTAVSGEGNAFMTANGLTTPALQSAWAAKVLANAANYAGIVGLLDAWRSQAKIAVTGAADQAALDLAITANAAAADAAIATIPVV